MGMVGRPSAKFVSRTETGMLNEWEAVGTWQEQHVRKGVSAGEMGGRQVGRHQTIHDLINQSV